MRVGFSRRPASRLSEASVALVIIFSAGSVGAQNAVAPGPVEAELPPLADEVQATERVEFQQIAPGLLVRRNYSVEIDDGASSQLWDLLVGPGMRSAPVVLEGAALIFVRAGDGLVSLDGKEQELQMGASISVPEGVEVSFTNRAKDRPLAARAVIITTGPQR
ncbi:MAG: hypothetical protein AAF184_13255 [Pseudomonadota bacterium]